MNGGLLAIDVLAGIFVLIGFHLAFRQRLLGPWLGAAQDQAGLASVLRMVGVMIMAFSITAAAFANLIAHYAATSPN